ncbi:hypothetical protein [Cronobacter dublinensis]|uniref:hypothetical protein n=1 Tax=Cronobacter dublinensis TaxID=413497 RepID=UPI00300E670C
MIADRGALRRILRALRRSFAGFYAVAFSARTSGLFYSYLTFHAVIRLLKKKEGDEFNVE